jgi:peptide-methionine (S)-S-oxide reductase
MSSFVKRLTARLAAGLVLTAFLGGAESSNAWAQAQPKQETAVFAGGCFWCVEADFDKVEGVIETTSGFAGGHVANPAYKQVVYGGTGHLEVVRIVYDPGKVSYKTLVDYFWRTIDPTDNGGQFCDRGESYRTAIFAQNEEQAKIAEASKAALNAAKRLAAPIVTEVRSSTAFYAAEDYHQNYYKNNELKYKYYRTGCGRDARVKALWGPEALKFPPPAS